MSPERRATYSPKVLGPAWLATLIALAITPAARADTTTPRPHDPDPSSIEAVRGLVAAREYHATPTGGALTAPNRAQNLRSRYLGEGLIVEPRDGASSWSWGWETDAWGREGAMQALGDVEPRASASRVHYAHHGFVEWYENTPAGIEQGFTIDERAPGTGALHIVGRVSWATGMRLADGGQAIEFTRADGATGLRYDHLLVVDAGDRVLPSKLALEGERIHIVVDDREAEYPIVVDPLLTNPQFTDEGDQADAELGTHVYTAGDVNGDGYSDVLACAPRFDEGQLNEGIVFVYPGSPDGVQPQPMWLAKTDENSAGFGLTAATAGDVNGDGYDDVIVGAPALDGAGGTNAGTLLLWLGSATDLGTDGSPANVYWKVSGSQPSMLLGSSVGTAGDVNGDGYDDIIAGAVGYDGTETNEGAAFVWYGSATGPSGFGATDATADWRATMGQALGDLGESVATAGDVNGDGYDDVIVGCPDCGDDAGDGQVFVWHGGPSGLGADGSPAHVDWSAEVDQDEAAFGTSVSTAGDVNGDGYADVIVGAPFYDYGNDDDGRAFVWHGSKWGLGEGFDGTLDNLDWHAIGGEFFAFAATSVGTAGDVNGDGYADVVVGAPGAGTTGKAWIWFGGPGGLPGFSGTPGNADWSANLGNGIAFGQSVGPAGDVNGDGFSDVIVGAPEYSNVQEGEGLVAVYLGGPYGPDNAPVWSRNESQATAQFGEAVAAAGDVNGDGFADVIVGAYLYDGGDTNEGRVSVYYGTAGEPSASPDWTAEVDVALANFGDTVAGAGDVNGDGYDDIVVGARRYASGQTAEGAIFGWYGGPDGLGPDGTVANADFVIQSNRANAFFGSKVAGVGDVNGDGYADVAAGTFSWTNPHENEGGIWVWYGGPGGIPSGDLVATADWFVEGNGEDVGIGFAEGASDVNGDGFGDLVVGNPSVNDVGAAYLWLGGPSGLSGDGTPGGADWFVMGPPDPFGSFGSQVASAGDVNQDGYADVIVSAPFNTSFADREGVVYAYYGSPAGLPATHDWTTAGGFAQAGYGVGVSSGDIDGDGYSDAIIGQYRFVPGMLGPGSVYGYLGSADGLGVESGWHALHTLGDDDDSFGVAVAGAGDVNGDGFCDVLVGAPNAGANAGQVQLFYGNAGDLHHLTRRPFQLEVDESTPIALLGEANGTELAIRLDAESALGRDHVALEWEVVRYDEAFDGSTTTTGTWTLTGDPDDVFRSFVTLTEPVAGLDALTPYKWRVRVVVDSPIYPRSPWFTLALNGMGEYDVRTGSSTVAVGDPASHPGGARLRVGPAVPNPFGARTAIGFELFEDMDLTLGVYDTRGRLVARPFEGRARAGAGVVAWEGTSSSGERLPSGVYFYRLEGAGEVARGRMTIVR